MQHSITNFFHSEMKKRFKILLFKGAVCYKGSLWRLILSPQPVTIVSQFQVDTHEHSTPSPPLFPASFPQPLLAKWAWPCSCPHSAKSFILSCFNKASFKQIGSCFLSPHIAARVPQRGKQWKRQELCVSATLLWCEMMKTQTFLSSLLQTLHVNPSCRWL